MVKDNNNENKNNNSNNSFLFGRWPQTKTSNVVYWTFEAKGQSTSINCPNQLIPIEEEIYAR